MIQYSQRDVPRNKKNRIVRSFFEGESFSFKPFPFAMNMMNVVLMEPSPSWNYLAVMRSVKEKGEEEEKYLIEVRRIDIQKNSLRVLKGERESSFLKKPILE